MAMASVPSARPLCSVPKVLRTPEEPGLPVRLARQHQCRAQSEGLQQAAPSVEMVRLGQSDVFVSPIGVGAWSWGDTGYWHQGGWDDRKLRDAKEAFNAGLDGGLNFFDTAEVYGSKLMSGFGGVNSESIIGRFMEELPKEERSKVVIATKFGAFPWRITRGSVVAALKDSLQRLQVSSVDLYQLHWPGIWANGAYLDGLADAVELGLVKAVGVSNYKENRLREAHSQLQRRGVQLASNQVNYSLIYRQPEENGVKRACEELGITLIAYSPIAQGVLSGKYTPSNPPNGPRGAIYNSFFLAQLEPVFNKLREIGQGYDKTPTQVALNWLLAQNVVPIPGAKTASQAREFAGVLGWKLSDEEVTELRETANRVPSAVGFPAEYL